MPRPKMSTKAERREDAYVTGVSQLSHDLSLELYKSLYTTRRAEELIQQHYFDDEMKTPMHMSAGQEAIPVGVCHALEANDQVYSTYRSHATYLTKTKDTDRFFAELYGKVTGRARGRAGSMHLADPAKKHIISSAIVGSGPPLAVGTAFTNRYLDNKNIACVFFGDGSLEEGAFWESLNIACVMQLPTLFVCEDNDFAVHTPKNVRQGYKSITDIVSKFECTVFQENTTDVEKIYALTKNAIAPMRSSGGPVFLHLKCYRYLEHVGVNGDFEAGYRDKTEYEEWKKRDCITLQRNRLLQTGMTEAEVKEAETDIDAKLQESLERAQTAPFSDTDEIYTGVFYEPHA